MEKRYHAVIATEYETIAKNSGEDYWFIVLIEKDKVTRELLNKIHKHLKDYVDTEIVDYMFIDPKVAPRLIRQDWAESVGGDSSEYSARGQELMNIKNFEVSPTYTVTLKEIEDYQEHFTNNLNISIEELMKGVSQ
jgi:hypothetical protein